MTHCPYCALVLRMVPDSVSHPKEAIESRHTLQIRRVGYCESCGLQYVWDVQVLAAPAPRLETSTAAAVPSNLDARKRAEERDRFMGLRDQRAILRANLEDQTRREQSGQLAVQAATGMSPARAETERSLQLVEKQMAELAKVLREYERTST